jgi:hypothetical protein
MSYVRIGHDKRFYGPGGVGVKEKHSLINRVAQRTAEDKLASLVALPSEREMLGAELLASLHVVRNIVVKEKVVHAFSSSGVVGGLCPVLPAGLSQRDCVEGRVGRCIVPYLQMVPANIRCHTHRVQKTVRPL